MTGGILAAAWIAQGMVDNPQIVVTPLLFVFLGVLNAMRADTIVSIRFFIWFSFSKSYNWN